MWSCQRGDGLGMAWRAGAQMRNAEWGPFAQLAGIRGKEPLIGSEDALYNAWHEKLSPTFRAKEEPDVCARTSAVWYQQMMAGNGPLVTFHPENWMLANTTEDVEGGTVWDRPLAVKFWTTLISRIRAADAPGAFLEVYPAVLGELSPIRVDHQMATTLPGLYACGNACYNGSGLPGAVPASPGRMRGSGLYGATFMGIRAGEAAASAPLAAAEVDPAQAEQLLRDAFAPLERADGVSAMDLVHEVQAAVNPVGYSIYKSEERMTEALGLVEDVKAQLPRVAAKDPHYLVAAHDARNMALSAELFYRTALTRKESRGWFVREDYPERNDADWLKWICAEPEGDGMRIWTEDVPVADYQYQPTAAPAVERS
jgi:succinate dehydrogenase/fumarate reductase flavoprotein subunit